MTPWRHHRCCGSCRRQRQANMSYILDALKKSERERELVRMLRTAGTSHHFWMPTRRRMWPAIIGLALLIGITVTVVRFWSPTDRSLAASADRSSVPVPTAATEPAKAPAVTSDGQQNAITVGHTKTATDDLAAQLQSTSAQRPTAAADGADNRRGWLLQHAGRA